MESTEGDRGKGPIASVAGFRPWIPIGSPLMDFIYGVHGGSKERNTQPATDGASTGVIQLTTDNPLSITGNGASSARMLLHSGQIDWSVVAGQLQTQIYTRSVLNLNFTHTH